MERPLNYQVRDGSEAGPDDHRLVCFAPSLIHGRGGFARTDILRGTPLIEYLGERIDKRESIARCSRNNEYIFSLNDEFDLDGNVERNVARFLNHSCSPNAEARLIEGRIWILARRDINAGEEITFNYGYDLEDYPEHPCRCGSSDCVGFIVAEEFFPKFETDERLPGTRASS